MRMERGVSVTLDYVMMLTIASIVLASVVFLSGVVIDTQMDRGLDDQLTATGETLAADLHSADRLAGEVKGQAGVVEVESSLPSQLSGTTYSIEVNGSDSELRLKSHNPERLITVPFSAEHINETYEVRGGTLLIILEDGELEVKAG